MKISLDDKYDLTKRQIYASGTQALVRMLLMQKARDAAAGLVTSGFVSGYRGSPLGGLDLQLWRARKALQGQDIHFEPGINEELAATAIWGTQQIGFYDKARCDGVFSLWYGKGPGVDRTGDVFRHGNLNGSAPHGGVLALMGDDHNAESSTNAHATEFQFVDVMMPILNPAGVQEVIDYGLYGYALSRFSGAWVSMKCVKDNIESTASVDGSLDRIAITLPDFDFPGDGLQIRPEIDFLAQERRLHGPKRAAMEAFIGANPINRVIYQGGTKPRLGIVTVGKSFLDTRQALDDLGIDADGAEKLGLKLIKFGCPWPLNAAQVKGFMQGLEHVLVVEEKRGLIEGQLKEILYGLAAAPLITGKRDEYGAELFSPAGSLDPNQIAIAIGERLIKLHGPLESLSAKVANLRQYQAMLNDIQNIGTRVPYFCSGCPHNSSTKVPEGSRAAAGIGCHFMSIWMDRDTYGFTHMGGEGAQWVGEARFSQADHIFQNIGDGTYNHSGILALRFAVSSGVNITYKILYNDAVALTGGQPNDGVLSVDQMAHQVRAEGVERIAIISDEPEKYTGVAFPRGASIHLRDDLDAVQREFRHIKGTSVIIYDQTCAAEKRRRRKRGVMADPDKRVIINELVCEGCGDCGVQSNCVSIQPVETPFGRKRRIDQASCNKDFSCLKGFCPSFVTVQGGVLKKAEASAKGINPLDNVPEPMLANVDRGWAAILTGIGGTGIVTIGALLGMAAHLEGKGCGIIDMAGLAQKGGGVTTHIRIAPTPDEVSAIRVSAGKADVVFGGDVIVTGTKPVLSALRPDDSLCLLNTSLVMPGAFTKDIALELPNEQIITQIKTIIGAERLFPLDASQLAEHLLGDSMMANILLLGFAYQAGALPVAGASIEQAMTLNGKSIDLNIAAFRWGRRAFVEPEWVRSLVARDEKKTDGNLQEMVVRRAAFLADYQNSAYADRFIQLMDRVIAAEHQHKLPEGTLGSIVAQSLFKVMAIKDEYEIARLYAGRAFKAQLAEQFADYKTLEFHLAPPLLSRIDADGRPVKRRFGIWMMQAFKLLQYGKNLRGTMFDPFGYTQERQEERATREQYFADVKFVLAQSTLGNLAAVQDFLAYPQNIRGFGPVRADNYERAMEQRARILAAIGGADGEFVNPVS